MKKIITLLLLYIAFAFGADYKPFTFENIAATDSAQQLEWDILMKYKVFGAYTFSVTNNSVRLTDKSGWIGTSKGDLVLAQNGGDTLGGPIIVGGDLTFRNGPDVFTTGPVNVYGNVNVNEEGFKDRANIFNGFQCIKGTVAPKYEAFVPNEYEYFGDNYETCPVKDSHPNDTNLVVPYITTADTTYQEAIFIDNTTHLIEVPDGSYKEPYDIYIDKITFANAGKLVIGQQSGGRLTRIFLKNGISYSNNCSVIVAYRDSITGDYVELENSDYSGTLLFYSLESIKTASFNKDVAKFQGSIISYKTIEIAHHMVLAGQLLANNMIFDTDFDGSGFLYVPFDPPVLNIDPTALASGKFIENDKAVKIPITLDTIAKTTVYFNYCFDLDNSKASIEDFNEPLPPVCGVDSGSVVILDSTKTPVTDVYLNVFLDGINEGDETLKLKIFNLTGAVLPGNVHTGYFTLTLTDGDLKNTSVELDKTDTIKTYQEELRIPPGSGVVGNIAYTDDGLVPLVWSFEDPSGFFDVKDGIITTNHIFDYETEDTVYVIKVKVEDGEFADSANYTIKITNIQEPITAYGKIETINEGADIGTYVGAIIGKDADSTDVTYSINDVVNFKIDPVLGVITTNAVFDFETKDKYPVTVTVTSTDGSKKDTTFIVNIIDVDEPVHAHDTTLTVKEGDKGVIGTIKGEDEDGKPVKFSCDDTVHYSIDSNTGVLRLVDPFDYETTKADTLKVVVTDVNGNTDTATIYINVANVNEPPVLQPNDSLTVPENCDTCFVGIIVAVDPDTDKVIYEVKEPGFKIDSNGVLTVTKPLDYEKTPEVKITVIAKDSSGAADTATYKITVVNVNEPVHVNDTTCSVKENYTGKVCQIPATDEDKTTPKYFLTDTTDYQIDSTGTLVIKNPIDFEKKTKDTVKIVVTDGKFYDTATVVIRVLDEPETVKITEWDKNPPPDTVKTNDPDHEYKWKICEGDSCKTHYDNPQIHKDTTIKVCNANKTVCDSIVVIFNDAPPVVTLSNAKSTDALIDYITIEEEKDDKIYVNKKENTLTVTVRDTVHKTEKSFPIDVKLDTVHVSSKNVTEYNYLIDESLATYTQIGGGLIEVKEVVKDGDRKITLTKIVNKNMEPIDTVQTVTYTVKQDSKELTITYKTDNLTGQRVSDYEVSYKVDSCTTVSYYLGDDKKIAKNKEGNIAYTVTYDYTDDFGNKASSKVDIIFDDIPPKVEILKPIEMESFNTNAIAVKWTVNGETQDTLTLQRLENGVNYVIRRYVDKAGNVAADTIRVIMKEAKDIDISLVHPVTKVDQDKVDEYYSEGHKYNDKKPYDIKFVDPKNDSLPEVIGVGFKVDIVLPSVSPTGNVSTLSDIIKNDKIPVDDNGNVVGASNLSIPVEEYINENCTDDFRQDYHKNGTNIPLYNVKYNLHLWIYTSNANYVNDFEINYDIDSKTEANSASIANFVIDWVPEKDGNVKAKNQHSLGTGAYLVKLYSKSTAIYRCGFKNQKAGDKITKKEYNLKSFGYKRPNK